jgi:hypothetical protein
MDINEAFDSLQEAADADPGQVAEARRRRDLFRDAFAGEAEVIEVVPSGSLARSTQREPINDVDVILVFDGSEHPGWGQPGDSAEEALKYTGGRINALLGATNGTFAKEVRLARPGNHAVKCFLDDPDDPDAFTVDATPALRQADGTLRIPEKSSEDWIPTDPEHLIKLVADRQKTWDLFRPLVRVLKLWKDVQDTGLKSLTVEVLALDCLKIKSSRPRALYRFFNAAELAIDQPIQDPAGLCGDIQPDLDVAKARAAIADAAKASWAAISAEDQGDTDRAACLWRSIFGDPFPEPEGGCANADEDEDEESAFGPFGIGTGAGAATGIGISDPRPVTDAPQG